MVCTATLNRSFLSRRGFRSLPHQLYVVRACYLSHWHSLTLEMKRKAEEPTDVETSGKVAKIGETQPEAGSSSSLAVKGAQQTGATKQKKKKGRAWKDKGEDSSRKVGRRGRRRELEGGEPTEPKEGDEPTEPKAPRLPKRQCALLIGFCGTGYSGMQFQPSVPRTIEGTLFNAMVKAGAVSADNAEDPLKVNLARAARTDAGVHAAGNVVSMKTITALPDVPDFVARINELLPPEIRLWGYVRAQNSFNARMVCDSRKYTYYFPSYMLLPPKPGCGFDHALRRQHDSSADAVLDYEFWKGHESSTHEEDLTRKRAWRASPRQMEKLRETATKFEGTHNFHNFTVGREFEDRSNQRHMKKIEVVDPVVYGETEWISVLFHGQSFMLHQIRKMMTILVLSCRTGTPSCLINEMYNQRPVLIPKMPSLGLLLEEPVFESYNKRMTVINEKLHPSDAEYRPPIDFDLYRDQIVKFKDDFIYKNMREVEDQIGLFDAWIRIIDIYTGNDLLYFNSKGTVPDIAVIQKGVRRKNPFKERRKFNTTGFLKGDNEAKARLQEEENEEDVDDTHELPEED